MSDPKQRFVPDESNAALHQSFAGQALCGICANASTFFSIGKDTYPDIRGAALLAKLAHDAAGELVLLYRAEKTAAAARDHAQTVREAQGQQEVGL